MKAPVNLIYFDAPEREPDQQWAERHACNNLYFHWPFVNINLLSCRGVGANSRREGKLFFGKLIPDLVMNKLRRELVADKAHPDGNGCHVFCLFVMFPGTLITVSMS